MGQRKIQVLIVEDDSNISQMLTDLLQQNGYETMLAYSGTEAILCIEKKDFDLMLLDLMLPGITGEEVIQKVKKFDEVKIPCIIAVSAKDDTFTKIKVLKEGADDYLTKPFDTEELLARMEVVLRRNRKIIPEENRVLNYKDITINQDSFEVFVGSKKVILTKREYQILELLMEHPTKVFTKNNIYESVWQEEFLGEENAVNVHISNIRQKLAKINSTQNYIQTVWGIGFKME